jgi:hypothetical protein
MKVIALIEYTAVVRKILEHLDLWQIRRGDDRGTAPENDNPGGAGLGLRPGRWRLVWLE